MKNFFRCFIDDYHEGMKQMYHGKNKVRRHTFRGDDDFLMVMMQSLRGERERAIGSLHCGHTGGVSAQSVHEGCLRARRIRKTTWTGVSRRAPQAEGLCTGRAKRGGLCTLASEAE